MKKRNSLVFIIFIVLIIIVGCNDDKIIEESPEPMKVTSFIPVIYPPNANPHILRQEAIGGEDVRNIDIQFSELLVITDDVGYEIEQINDWRIAHDKVSKILKEYSTNKFKFYLEQIIANKMLSMHLLPVDEIVDRDRQAAIAFYTDLLLRNNHPNAHIIVEALQLLEGYWSYDRIAQAADNAMVFAEGYLSKQNYVEVSGLDKKSLDSLEDEQQVVLHKINFAIPQLVKLKSNRE